MASTTEDAMPARARRKSIPVHPPLDRGRAAPSRIAVFLPNLRGGGAERAMLLFAREALDRGLRVDIVVGRADGPFGRLVPPGCTVVDLGRGRVLAAIPALARYLRRTRPDALYSTLAHCNIAALLASRLACAGVRVVVREAVVPISSDDAKTVSGHVIRHLIPIVYRWAHAVIAVSGTVAEELHALGPGLGHRVVVLPTPVVSEQLLEEAERPLHHPWFADGAPPVVLGVGRLDPQKDFATLLRAFAVVRRRRPVRLIVLGEGRERPQLIGLSRGLGITADVELPGFVDNPFPYLKRAAVFVLSSRWEGMPTALLQAMALDTPVVSTDCPGGSREVLQHGRLGHLVAPGDVDALAQAVEAAVEAGPRPDAGEYVRRLYGASEGTTRYLELMHDRGLA
jgi:glycosyltransferase involved in cell wall biosynthesis